MTTAFERFRALARFPQMLRLAHLDELVPAELRAGASMLLEVFPDEQELCALVDSGCQALPAEIAQTLEGAVLWLDGMGRTSSLSIELREWHRWTARHFPDLADVEWMQRDMSAVPTSLRTPVNEWINPAA